MPRSVHPRRGRGGRGGSRCQKAFATGSEIFAKVDCAGEEISCLFRERLPLRQGAPVRIEIDRACAHLLDAKTGRRI